MNNQKGNLLLALIILVLLVQIYIMFFNDPVKLSRACLVESKILLQGKDPGVPQPVPGKEPEDFGNKVTVQTIGPNARPAVANVSHGEGQADPKVPLSLRPKVPQFGDILTNFNSSSMSIEKNEDYYKTLICGILILEENEKLAVTREQADQLKRVLELRSMVKDAVPRAQEVLLETLTDDQLKYIYFQMCRFRGGMRPLPPESLDRYSKEALSMVKKKI